MLDYLAEHHDEPLDVLAKALDVSTGTVSLKLRSLGYSKVRGGMKLSWSDYQLNYLREHFATMSASDISDVLGISPSTVSNKARELGLSKSPEWSKKSYNNRYVGNYHNV